MDTLNTIKDINGNLVSRDGVPVIPVTPAQMERLDAGVEWTRNLELPRLHDASDPNSRMFVMVLDGTENNRDKDAPGNWTNPALIEDSIKNDVTSASGSVIESRYRPGVGTNGIPIADTLDSALGVTVRTQAENGYTDFVNQANLWKQGNPDASISLTITGFSRGSAASLVAANLVHERGVPDMSSEKRTPILDDYGTQTGVEVSYERYLVPPGGVPQALLLYDQVATGPFSEGLNRTVPPSVVSAVHIVAENEYRDKFQSYSIEDPANPGDPRFSTIWIPGSHSDDGGSYALNGISSVTRLMGEIVLNKLGVGMPESTPESDPAKYVIHDSEFGWRPSDEPTPPLESRPERITIIDKGFGEGLSNPPADPVLMERFYGNRAGEGITLPISTQAGDTQDTSNLVFTPTPFTLPDGSEGIAYVPPGGYAEITDENGHTYLVNGQGEIGTLAGPFGDEWQLVHTGYTPGSDGLEIETGVTEETLNITDTGAEQPDQSRTTPSPAALAGAQAAQSVLNLIQSLESGNALGILTNGIAATQLGQQAADLALNSTRMAVAPAYGYGVEWLKAA